MSIPEEWPWEEAKKIFEKPDVVPAEEVEVGPCLRFVGKYELRVLMGQTIFSLA